MSRFLVSLPRTFNSIPAPRIFYFVTVQLSVLARAITTTLPSINSGNEERKLLIHMVWGIHGKRTLFVECSEGLTLSKTILCKLQYIER